MAQEKILIALEDASARQSLKSVFFGESMNPTLAKSGAEVLELIRAKSFDFIILDMMLQDMEGYEVLRIIRGDHNYTPVMMVSDRASEIEQVLCLGLGADDYVSKPFQYSVLIQKVRAILRRINVYDNAPKKEEIQIGPFRFNLVRLECYKNDVIIPFTAKELALFRYLMEHPNQVFSKEQLYRQVWNDNVVDDNTIMVYIKRIRQKIGDSPKNPYYLRTMRGIGYILYENSEGIY